MNERKYLIPADPPKIILDAGIFYHQELGLAVHPLKGPNANCPEKQKGKAPILNGWPNHTADKVTEEQIKEWFGNGHDYNLGFVVRPPLVVIDLDSKQDKGESVRRWLQSKPELAKIPRERTTGGAHLYFICRGLPQFLNKGGTIKNNAPSWQIVEGLTAELFHDGQNIVVSPSVHRSGHLYQWEVTGEIPEVKWADLARMFEYKEPEKNQAEPEKKGKHWWSRFEGDLRTLDIVALAEAVGLKPRKLGEGKYAIKCPWGDSHGEGQHGSTDSSTVIFEAKAGAFPNWKCLHATHGDKSFEDLLLWIEQRHPGLVDQHCREKRVWQEGQKDRKGRLRIRLPQLGREISAFADEVGKALGERKVWFVKGHEVVDIRDEQLTDKIKCVVFHEISPTEARSSLERFVQPGVLKKDENQQMVFLANSMSREVAAALLVAPQFIGRLPRIERILDVPIPLIREERLVYPKPDYDEELKTFCLDKVVLDETMSLDKAKELLFRIHSEFCFKDKAIGTRLAIARLLTSFCRGLMGWDAKTPLWIFEANRPRAGKDYLAAITQLVFEGRANEDAPLDSNSEETCKRITSALRAGRRRMHFANSKGHIDNATFEQAVTSKMFSARNLGKNDGASDLNLPNELEFSVSGNIGFSFTEDFDLRCRKISLAYPDEDANARKFEIGDLHAYVLANRREILSALAALVRHWFEQGCPEGRTPFTSFPEWAKIVGGIMVCCDLGDPCISQHDDGLTGDELTQHMKILFRHAYDLHGKTEIKKKQIYELISESEDVELFPWWDLKDRKGQTSFGTKLRSFDGRILGGIRLDIDSSDKSRLKYRFSLTDTTKIQEQVKPAAGMTLGVCEPCGPREPVYPLSSLSTSSPKRVEEPEVIYTHGCGGQEVRRVSEVRNQGMDRPVLGNLLSDYEKEKQIEAMMTASTGGTL